MNAIWAEMQMTDPIFVDSAFIPALINERDQYHAQAVRLSEQLEGRQFLITNAVFFEVHTSWFCGAHGASYRYSLVMTRHCAIWSRLAAHGSAEHDRYATDAL